MTRLRSVWSVCVAAAVVAVGCSGLAVGRELDTLVGVEYAVFGLGTAFAGAGLGLVKPIPDSYRWGVMQPTATAPISFAITDRFVLEYQHAGFGEVLLALRSASTWASKDGLDNPAPKPEYMDDYERWVEAVVERYDGDGVADVPGLLRPVRFYEVGSEYSSYEPESAAEYLEVLERATRAAHRACPGVQVAHAAFLATTAFRDDPSPAQYEAAFAAVSPRIMAHSLEDIRAVLDRPELFDLVNFHALGDVAEIERTFAWLQWEMARRGYARPIIVSDTTNTAYVGWGPATRCTGPPGQLGLLIPPAVEADRCRLAAMFGKLTAGDAATVRWAHAFAAQDVVQRVVVAAEQGALLVDTWSTEDIPLFQAPLAQASGGLAAWAGMVEVSINLLTAQHTVKGYRPAFFALRHLMGHLNVSREITRVAQADPRARVYRLDGDGATRWVAWLDPGVALLPEDAVPELEVELEVTGSAVTVETVPTRPGQAWPERRLQEAAGGRVTVGLTPTPVVVVDSDAPAATPRVRRRFGRGPGPSAAGRADAEREVEREVR